MSAESDYGQLDHPHRRMGEKRLEAIVNNAWLRFLQFLLSFFVTAIALPTAVWGLNTVIDRLNGIDSKLFALQLRDAENAIKLAQAQKDAAEAIAQVNALRERMLAVEIRQGALPPTRGAP